MNLQEEKFAEVENQLEAEKKEQITAEVHHIEIPSDMLQKAVSEFEMKRQAQKLEKEKALAENPHYVELIVGAFEDIVPIFFRDESHKRHFVTNWFVHSKDSEIVANDVKLKRDLGTDKTCNLRLDKKVYSGIIYYGQI